MGKLKKSGNTALFNFYIVDLNGRKRAYNSFMKSKIARIICFIFCCVSVLLAPTLCYFKLRTVSGNDGKAEYKCVLNVWHTDTFPGGFGSRKRFIEKVAKSFEKKNKGVLVRVTDMSITAVNERLNSETPDVISYGTGVTADITKLLALPFESGKGGIVHGKTYACVWARNCYILFAKKGKTLSDDCSVIVGQSECNLPSVAFYTCGYRNPVIFSSPEKACSDFLCGNADFFVGTLKDLYRLDKRGVEYDYTVLGDFDDLLQYVSVYDGEKSSYGVMFAESLVFSELKELNESIGLMKENGESLAEPSVKVGGEYKTISAFMAYNAVKELQNALKGVSGKDEILNILKNALL